jgi:hypothetical protein
MPIPGGELTGTEIWTTPEVIEEVEEVVEEDEDDLPELS